MTSLEKANGFTFLTPDPAAEVARKSRPAGDRPEGLSRVRHLIAVGSGKGGVGKSTVTTNLAVALQRMGAKVALLDADIYGPSQPRLLGAVDQKADLSQDVLRPLERHGVGFISVSLLMDKEAPVVWRAPMAVKMLQQFVMNVAWGDLDYLLIDLPPGTGDVQLSIAQGVPLTGSVVVTTPQDVALGVAKKGLQMFQQVKVPILGVIENMSGFVCTKCGEANDLFKKGGGVLLAKDAGVPFLGAIPLDGEVVRSGDDGTPVALGDGSAAKAFIEAARALERAVAASQAGAVEPPEAVLVEGALALTWSDGRRSSLAARALRLACACAACVEETTGRKILDPGRVPLDVKILGVTPVGRYGLGLAFSDGHNTGIYTFDKLAALDRESQGPTPPSFRV
jgi:ATP-binding protein involved in chromosome partitioning